MFQLIASACLGEGRARVKRFWCYTVHGRAPCWQSGFYIQDRLSLDLANIQDQVIGRRAAMTPGAREHRSRASSHQFRGTSTSSPAYRAHITCGKAEETYPANDLPTRMTLPPSAAWHCNHISRPSERATRGVLVTHNPRTILSISRF